MKRINSGLIVCLFLICTNYQGVGILFVHEGDEQVYESLQSLSKKYLLKWNIKRDFCVTHMRLIIPMCLFVIVYLIIVIISTFIRIVLEDYNKNDYFA